MNIDKWDDLYLLGGRRSPCSCISLNRLTALGMSVVGMRRGFFWHAGVVSFVDGIRLRSMAGLPTPTTLGGGRQTGRARCPSSRGRPVQEQRRKVCWAPGEGTARRRRHRARREGAADAVVRRQRCGSAEHDVQGLLLHHHDGVHDGFASQVLAVGQGLGGEEPLDLLPLLLLESGRVLAILNGFAPASALLRLDSPLCRRQVLRWFPCLDLLLRPLAGGGRSCGIGGGIHRFCFFCRCSNIGQGFWRDKSGLCANGGRERQINWADAGGHARCPGRCKLAQIWARVASFRASRSGCVPSHGYLYQGSSTHYSRLPRHRHKGYHLA
jgi:hypothetical protein